MSGKTFSRGRSLGTAGLVLAFVLAGCAPAAAPSPTAAPAPPKPAAEKPAAEKPAPAAPAKPAEKPPAQPPQKPAAQPVTIKLWHMPNGADPNAAIQAEIAAFQNTHPNIAVEAEQIDWGAAFTKIQTAIQGGEGPCITQLGTTWVPGFSAMGGLRPYSADELTALGGGDAFVKASWETSGLAGKNEVTAVPWFADVRAVAYRKDYLEKAGLKPEEAFKDLNAFESALQKIKQVNPGVAPLVHPGKNDWNVWQNSSMWIWAYGGDLLTPDFTKAAFNSAEGVKGVTHFASFYGKGLTAPDTLELNSAQTDQKFAEDKAATVISGPWLISNARAPKDKGGWENQAARNNLAFAEFPAGPGGQYTFVGGSNLAIFKSCKTPEAAAEFVKFLAGKESQVRYAQAIGMLPAKKDAQADAAFTNDPLYSVFLNAAPRGKTSAAIPQWGQVEPALQEQLQVVWEDVAASPGKPITETQVKERLDRAARAVDNLLVR